MWFVFYWVIFQFQWSNFPILNRTEFDTQCLNNNDYEEEETTRKHGISDYVLSEHREILHPITGTVLFMNYTVTGRKKMFYLMMHSIQWTLPKPDPYGTRKICWFRRCWIRQSFSYVLSQFGTEKSILFRQISELDRCRFGQSVLYILFRG